jgi:hypothetical protein
MASLRRLHPNYRPEYQHAWGSKSVYSQVRLDALPAETAEELLDVLLGDDPSLALTAVAVVATDRPASRRPYSRWCLRQMVGNAKRALEMRAKLTA